LSADTVTTDGYNRYAYAQDNPLNYRDPTGHWRWPTWQDAKDFVKGGMAQMSAYHWGSFETNANLLAFGGEKGREAAAFNMQVVAPVAQSIVDNGNTAVKAGAVVIPALAAAVPTALVIREASGMGNGVSPTPRRTPAEIAARSESEAKNTWENGANCSCGSAAVLSLISGIKHGYKAAYLIIDGKVTKPGAGYLTTDSPIIVPKVSPGVHALTVLADHDGVPHYLTYGRDYGPELVPGAVGGMTDYNYRTGFTNPGDVMAHYIKSGWDFVMPRKR
jgi:hypothetical protein